MGEGEGRERETCQGVGWYLQLVVGEACGCDFWDMVRDEPFSHPRLYRCSMKICHACIKRRARVGRSCIWVTARTIAPRIVWVRERSAQTGKVVVQWTKFILEGDGRRCGGLGLSRIRLRLSERLRYRRRMAGGPRDA